MLSACTPRICPPRDHLQSLGGRWGDRWEVRRNNGFAAMWTNQPFFISHRVESRRRLLSPEQCGPQLCQFLFFSQGVRADLVYFLVPQSSFIGLTIYLLEVFLLKNILGREVFIMSLSGTGIQGKKRFNKMSFLGDDKVLT